MTVLPAFETLLHADMQHLNRVIREQLYSDVALVRQVAEHIIHSGGKRIRPMLLLLAANALGADVCQRYKMAAALEFIHTATLLHDDVVDESGLRRSQQTANVVFGNAASVLVGDFMYSRAFQIMVDVGDMRVMRIMSEATNTIAEGEVLQLMNCHDPDVDEASYLQVIRYKTARLFQAATESGAALAGASDETQEALARYGMHLGTAFQLVDDVLDYSGDEVETGKHLGDDLAEGKPTLPLIRVMEAGASDERAMVRETLLNGGRDDFAAVLKAINANDALGYTRKQAWKEAEIATQAIAGLKASKHKEALLELAGFAVTRAG